MRTGAGRAFSGLVAIGVAAALGACDDDAPAAAQSDAPAAGVQSPAEPAEPAAPDQRAGAKVYLAFCASCHAQDGTGGAGVPDLTGSWGHVELDGTAADLERTMAHIRDAEPETSMPAFDGMLTEDELEQVARYVLSLRSR